MVRCLIKAQHMVSSIAQSPIIASQRSVLFAEMFIVCARVVVVGLTVLLFFIILHTVLAIILVRITIVAHLLRVYEKILLLLGHRRIALMVAMMTVQVELGHLMLMMVVTDRRHL